MILNQFAFKAPEQVEVKRTSWIKYRTNKGDFIDAMSGMYNSPLGFGNKNLMVPEDLYAHNFQVYPGMAMVSEPQLKLTKTLLEKVPFANGVFYTNSGSEAVDSAIRMAQTGKRKTIVSIGNSYHGSTQLARKVSGNFSRGGTKDFRFYPFFGGEYLWTKDRYLEEFEYMLKKNAHTIAAVIAEPMIGASGGQLMHDNVLPEMLHIAHDLGIKFILDEVISGFWRMGPEFAFQLYGIEPDFVILSKAITNGMWPMAVVMVKQPSAITVDDFGFTMAGHPTGCAIANETLKLLDSKGSQSHEVGEMMRRMIRRNMHTQTVLYQQGSFLSLQIFDGITNSQFPRKVNIGGQIARRCFEKGVIVRGTPWSVIMAPAFVTDLSAAAVITTTLREATGEVLDNA